MGLIGFHLWLRPMSFAGGMIVRRHARAGIYFWCNNYANWLWRVTAHTGITLARTQLPRVSKIHDNDVIMSAMASQITSVTIAYSTVYSGTYQRYHQSSASLAFVWGIHRWTVNSLHKGPVTRKLFPFDDVIMMWLYHQIMFCMGQLCDSVMILYPFSHHWEFVYVDLSRYAWKCLIYKPCPLVMNGHFNAHFIDLQYSVYMCIA